MDNVKHDIAIRPIMPGTQNVSGVDINSDEYFDTQEFQQAYKALFSDLIEGKITPDQTDFYKGFLNMLDKIPDKGYRLQECRELLEKFGEKGIRSSGSIDDFKKHPCSLIRFIKDNEHKELFKQTMEHDIFSHELRKRISTLKNEVSFTINDKNNTPKYGVCLTMLELMEVLGAAETTLRTFYKSKENETMQWIKKPKRGIYCIKANCTKRLKGLLAKK